MQDRRAFLTKLGAIATAPVMTAFVSDQSTGLSVPDRQLETVPPPMVISSLTAGPPPGFGPGELLRSPHGALLFYVNGEPWQVLAWRVSS